MTIAAASRAETRLGRPFSGIKRSRKQQILAKSEHRRLGLAISATSLLLATLVIALPSFPPAGSTRRLFFFSGGCQEGVEVVVSVATVAQRLAFIFPVTLRALLRQSVAECATYWVFVPSHDRSAAQAAIPELDATARRFGRVVYIHFVPDRLSANKFLFSVEALAHPEPGDSRLTANSSVSVPDVNGNTRPSGRFFSGGQSWRPSAESTVVLGLPAGQQQPSTASLHAEVTRLRRASALLLICDDDWVHHPRLAETLLKGRRRAVGERWGQNALSDSRGWEVAIGTRGYRVREDFTWGVGSEEFKHHVIEGWQLAAPYRTGVATSGKGILIALGPALARFNMSDFGDAPHGAHFVDDIWLNGHLAAAGVPRWVVPLPASAADMQVNGDSPLDRKLAAAQTTRWAANSDAIKYFKDAWEEEILYKFGGVNAPQYRMLLWRWVFEARAAFTLFLVRAGMI